MDWPKTITLAVSVLALAGIVVLYGNGIHTSIDALRAEAATDRAEAAADRRAHQDAMDTFRQEMRALAERQAHVEGRLIANVPAPVEGRALSETGG